VERLQMSQWAKCTHISKVEVYVNLNLVQTLTWEGSRNRLQFAFLMTTLST
jgi:hypothetical protein